MKLNSLILSLSTFSLLLGLATGVEAHSGRTDASGCHNSYKGGPRHCHNHNPDSSNRYEPSSGYGEERSNNPITSSSQTKRDLPPREPGPAAGENAIYANKKQVECDSPSSIEGAAANHWKELSRTADSVICIQLEKTSRSWGDPELRVRYRKYVTPNYSNSYYKTFLQLEQDFEAAPRDYAGENSWRIYAMTDFNDSTATKVSSFCAMFIDEGQWQSREQDHCSDRELEMSLSPIWDKFMEYFRQYQADPDALEWAAFTKRY